MSDKQHSVTPRPKKPRPLPITKLHPGTAEVATAMGWTVEVARLVADLPGCPRVRGGKGKRFTSVEAFKAWFEKLEVRHKLCVPEIDRKLREELAAEIAKITWANDDGVTARQLARDNTYAELVAKRDYWKDHDDEDRGQRAAADVLGSPVPW